MATTKTNRTARTAKLASATSLSPVAGDAPLSPVAGDAAQPLPLIASYSDGSTGPIATAPLPSTAQRKYGEVIAKHGAGYLRNGSDTFTLGNPWARDAAKPHVYNAIWLAAREAGATPNNAVSGNAIAAALFLSDGEAQKMLARTKATLLIKGSQYVIKSESGKVQAAGEWLAGYLTGAVAARNNYVLNKARAS